MSEHPLYDLYTIQNELREHSLQPEELFAASELHDDLASGAFHEKQAQAQMDIWGSVDRLTARAANIERVKKGLEPIEWHDKLAEICPMIQFVVVNEHTLGVINPQRPNVIEKLAHSIIRGATYGSEHDTIHQPWPQMRPAKIADFDTFRVCKTGYQSDSRYNFPVQ